MVQIIARHPVQDFDRWLPHFLAHAATRKKYGEEGATVQRSLDDPNDVVIVLRWKTAAGFRDFVENSDLREVMERAGVLSPPTITLLTDAVL